MNTHSSVELEMINRRLMKLELENKVLINCLLVGFGLINQLAGLLAYKHIQQECQKHMSILMGLDPARGREN